MTNLINLKTLKEEFIKDVTSNMKDIIETLQPELDNYLAVGFKWLEHHADLEGNVTKELMSSQENHQYVVSLPELKALENKLNTLNQELRENGVHLDFIESRVRLGIDSALSHMNIPTEVLESYISNSVRDLTAIANRDGGYVSVDLWTEYVTNSVSKDEELSAYVTDFYTKKVEEEWKKEEAINEPTTNFSLAISDISVIPGGSDLDGDSGILHYDEFRDLFHIQHQLRGGRGKAFNLDSEVKQMLGAVKGVKFTPITIFFNYQPVPAVKLVVH